MTPTTLVTGADAAAREEAILAVLRRDAGNIDTAALILEGLPGGLLPPPDGQGLPRLSPVVRIAPGCVCCTGNLTMRVTLNRLLRQHPARLYIGLASAAHLDAIRAFLTAPPYDALLALTQDLTA